MLPAVRETHQLRHKWVNTWVNTYRTFTLVFPLTYFPIPTSGPDITLRKTQFSIVNYGRYCLSGKPILNIRYCLTYSPISRCKLQFYVKVVPREQIIRKDSLKVPAGTVVTCSFGRVLKSNPSAWCRTPGVHTPTHIPCLHINVGTSRISDFR